MEWEILLLLWTRGACLSACLFGAQKRPRDEMAGGRGPDVQSFWIWIGSICSCSSLLLMQIGMEWIGYRRRYHHHYHLYLISGVWVAVFIYYHHHYHSLSSLSSFNLTFLPFLVSTYSRLDSLLMLHFIGGHFVLLLVFYSYLG
ncbi:hypothetical protein BDV06DRAFT_167353 [Aspergillus oleicola]